MLTEAEIDARMELLHEQISDNIKEYGQFVMCVGASSEEEAKDRNSYFMYTIGNCEHDLPELIIVGYMTPGLGPLINRLGALMRERNHPFENGEIFIPENHTHPVKIINCDERVNNFIHQAEVHYPKKVIRGQQIVLCDPEGLFPGEDGCVENIANQPLLGPMPGNNRVLQTGKSEVR